MEDDGHERGTQAPGERGDLLRVRHRVVLRRLRAARAHAGPRVRSAAPRRPGPLSAGAGRWRHRAGRRCRQRRRRRDGL
eukprot:5859129-Lingulodinium_polyedra.AAC.1